MAGARGEEAPSEVVTAIKFSFYTEEDARKMSVKRITEPILYDDRGNPAPNGLFDPALGPVKDTDSCKTCCQRSYQCSGHIGHIELAKPLYNPLLFTNLKRLLQVSCFYCHKFRMKEEEVRRYVSMLTFIKKGNIALAGSLNQLWLTKMLFQEEYEEKFAAVRSSESHSDSKHQQNPWTTLQNEKAESLLSEFMGRTTTKCMNCNQKNPRITSPTFGCLNKAMKASDARANIIRNSNIGVKSDTSIAAEAKKGEVQSKAGDNSSWRDEEMSVSRNRSKKTSPEIFEHKIPSAGQEPLLPTEAELILQGLWSSEPEFCSLICDIRNNSLNLSWSNKGYAMFFLKALLVPPCKFRPPAEAGQRILEHPQNDLLKKVQIVNNSLRNIITTDPGHEDTLRLWTDLQRCVNILFDSSKGIGKSDREATGYRQLLERKEGVIRQKMMGKRVDFSCRSVISPDPYLAVHEIGIPPYFALRLTIPERVTPWNVNKLRHAVINGADLHPGATHYKDNNSMFKLQAKRDTRRAISRKLPASRAVTSRTGKDPESEYEGKVVFRHLQDGDVVLVNRQPTLHKPSMMAHIVRVLKGEKTIRMHYANCKTYNADFDGDEMNVHVPQDEISRAEAINIVNANKQYIVPTSGDPIRGLIQDHIVSAVLLTKLDTFLTREEYHQLLYGSCVPPVAHSFEHGELGKSHTLTSSNEVQPLPPAILKPKPLWTGKQVITTILHYITRGRQPFTVEKKGQVPKEYFVANCFESVMHINSNELIHGMIDKAQFGNYGLVHTVYELYGADTAGTLLSIFSRLFTLFLQMHGFTCGLDDLLLIPHSDQERKEMLKDSEVESHVVHCNFASQDSRDQDPQKLPRQIEKILRSNGESAITRLDRMMSNSLNGLASDVNKKLFPTGLRKPFPKNCISLMTTTGAKGGLVNLTQISSLLGQQELEGKRVPRMASGKTLPCFPPWDISSRAGGFIGDRFLTGLRPQEYYFHCMAGRDGLVDTAIKTARSGYLQRCILKNLESLKVCYDYTVRDADGSVIQFTYGEDGVDVLKTSLITELKDANDQLAPFKLLAINRRVALEKLGGELEHAHFSKSNGFIRELPDKLRENATTFANSLLKNHKDSLHQIKRNEVMKLMELKYLDSLADPGEPVGVIAAQSVGEPSTQMTLNTFHLAGRGEMNVTLGIPRLQEILYGSKNIRTPVMTCPLLSGRTEKDGKHLAAKLRRVCVADVVESVEVSTVPFCIHQDKVSTIYKLKMKLYAPHLYPQHSGITLEGCRAVLTTTFVEVMEDAIEKHLLLLSKINDISVVSGKEEYTFAEGAEEEHTSKSDNGEDNDSHGVGGDSNDHDDGEADDTEDEGADAEKRKKQKNDEMEYEDSMDKERSTLADKHNEEPGCESEIDDVEANEDYEVGSEIPSNEGEVELPESPSRTEPEPLEKKSMKELKSKEKERKKNRKKIDGAIFVEAKGLDFEAHFILDTKPHILLAEIAQKTAKRVYVKASNNIERCSVIKQKDNKHSTLALQAAGVNFNAFYGLSDHLNIDEIVSNDVNAMLKHYGVEAARKTIVEEVKAVFEAYGIRVNIRHLTLIADFITSSGGYRPMNRLGMGDFNTSPFEKMSFETATKFIIKAAFHGEVDTLESPSASVSLGQPVKFGTGSFDVLQNL